MQSCPTHEIIGRGANASLRMGPATDAVVFGVVMLVAVCALMWMVALMYRSYSICCNLKGARAIWSFVGGVLAAEVVAIALSYLLRR